MDRVKISILGHVQPRDPESKFTAAGLPVTTWRMVANRRRRGPGGDQLDESDWFQVTAFGKLAQIADDHLRKGSKCMVEGRFSSRVWQDQNGKDRTSLDVIADELILLGSTGERWASSEQPQSGAEDLNEIPF